MNCLTCGNSFDQSRPNQHFCSNACRQKNYRLKSIGEQKAIATNQRVDSLVNQALALCQEQDVDPIYVAANLVYRETKEKLMKFPKGLRNRIMVRLIDEVLMKP